MYAVLKQINEIGEKKIKGKSLSGDSSQIMTLKKIVMYLIIQF
jgi:hypothetical protein